MYTLFFLLLFQNYISTPQAETVGLDHALYISVIEINHDPPALSADLKIKIFKDDLQSALKNEYAEAAILEETKICTPTNSQVSEYFTKHINGKINQQEIQLKFKGGEINTEAFWLTFEMDCPATWKTLALQTDFLMELFPTQSNMVHISDGPNKRFARLTKKENKSLFSF